MFEESGKNLLCMYREGRLSLGSLSKELKMPLSSTIDFLAKLGVHAPLEYEDSLQGLDLLKSGMGSALEM